MARKKAKRPGRAKRRLRAADGEAGEAGAARAPRRGRSKEGRKPAPKPGRGREGREAFVGLLRVSRGDGVVTPFRDERRRPLPVPRSGLRGGRDGDWVLVEPGRGRTASGRVSEVLGRVGAADADFRAVALRHALPVDFPPAALAELEGQRAELTPAEIARREDLRALPFLTLDPATARDHDDAVCVEPLPRGGTRLFVAIADVSARVPEGSALDREALRRSNSVYFPDRAIPMLPHLLSGDLCSLRPGVDRSTVVAVLDLDARGETVGRRFTRAVIRSRARLSYDEGAAVIDPERAHPDARPPGDPEIVAQLRGLARVATALMARRFEAGSIDFDLPTAEIVLGDEGHPVDVVEAPRTLAHRAIEEAMLAANRAVAGALFEAGIPLLYRVHEAPPPEDLEVLEDLLRSFRLLEPGGEGPLDARAIARAVSKAVGRPEERLVNLVTLRSMRQARYAESSLGHFALAFEHYAHFTSPIRRYADLVVHRALLDGLLGDAASRERALARGHGLGRVAARVSARERLAVDAERNMISVKKCVFMAPHAGEIHDGTVESVAPHGLYVTLAPFFVEGLVHHSRLPRGLVFDERGHAFTPRRGRGGFRLGDAVRVRVDGVDPARGWISFSLAREEGDGDGRGRRGYEGAWSSASSSAARRSHSR